MFRRALLTLMIPAAVLLGTHSASAENRLALVIGQSAYRSVPALPNPANGWTSPCEPMLTRRKSRTSASVRSSLPRSECNEGVRG